MPPKASFQLDLDHPAASRILHFPDLPGRSAGPDVQLESYHVKEEWTMVGNDHPQSIRWRGHVGTFIAEQLGRDVSKAAWHVSGWPKGYSLWVKRRKKNSAASAARVDWYLFGYGARKRFASPQEFAFHAVWLYDDVYHEYGECQCTLCTHRPQGEINKIWMEEGHIRRLARPPGGGGAGGHRGGGGGGGPAAEGEPFDGPLAELPHQNKVVRWHPFKSLLAGTSSVLPERDSDLKSQWPFRVDELVWVSVPSIPAPPPNAKDEAITFWPAVIKRVPSQQQPSTYTIYLLGVGTTHTIHERDILSWQFLPFRQGQKPENSELLPAGGRPIRLLDEEERSFDKYILGALTVALVAATTTISRHFRLIRKTNKEEPERGGFKVYQGFWYGAETIWVDDLVRLNLSREDLGTSGIEGLAEISGGTKDLGIFARVTNIGGNTGSRKFSARVYGLEFGSSDDFPTDQSPYPLPKPPRGYSFRQLSNDVILDLTTIAGRYHPLSSEDPLVRRVLEGRFVRMLKIRFGLAEKDAETLLKDLDRIAQKMPQSNKRPRNMTLSDSRKRILNCAEKRGRRMYKDEKSSEEEEEVSDEEMGTRNNQAMEEDSD